MAPPWQTIRQRVQVLREVILPGSLVIALVLLMRLIGWLQIHEWMLLDSFSRLCPVQPRQTDVVLIGIDETDLEQVGSRFRPKSAPPRSALSSVQSHPWGRLTWI
jgi:CHASE2 domain-containing sensor protein